MCLIYDSIVKIHLFKLVNWSVRFTMSPKTPLRCIFLSFAVENIMRSVPGKDQNEPISFVVSMSGDKLKVTVFICKWLCRVRLPPGNIMCNDSCSESARKLCKIHLFHIIILALFPDGFTNEIIAYATDGSHRWANHVMKYSATSHRSAKKE